MRESGPEGFQAGYRRWPLGTAIPLTSYQDNYEYKLGGQDTPEHRQLLERQNELAILVQSVQAKIRILSLKGLSEAETDEIPALELQLKTNVIELKKVDKEISTIKKADAIAQIDRDKLPPSKPLANVMYKLYEHAFNPSERYFHVHSPENSFMDFAITVAVHEHHPSNLVFLSAFVEDLMFVILNQIKEEKLEIRIFIQLLFLIFIGHICKQMCLKSISNNNVLPTSSEIVRYQMISSRVVKCLNIIAQTTADSDELAKGFSKLWRNLDNRFHEESGINLVEHLSKIEDNIRQIFNDKYPQIAFGFSQKSIVNARNISNKLDLESLYTLSLHQTRDFLASIVV